MIPVKSESITTTATPKTVDAAEAKFISTARTSEPLSDIVEDFLSAAAEDAEKVKLFLIGDDDDALDGYERALAGYRNQRVIGRTQTKSAYVLSDLSDCAPDILLFDIGRCVANHTRTIQLIRSMHPTTKILVLASDTYPLHVKLAMWAGAHGFIQKDAPSHEMAEVIGSIRDCQQYFATALGADESECG